MAITSRLKAYLHEELSLIENKPIVINQISAVSGGSINEAYSLHTSAGRYLIKVNSRTAYPDMFNLEVKGLEAIKATCTLATPDVIYCGDADDQSVLVLKWIDAGRADAASFTKLGRQLAEMHRHTADLFGLEHDNYMGSLPQSNRHHNTWSGFFIAERLQPMVQIAQRKHLLTAADTACFEKLYQCLPNLFNEENPSLLHGDLWSGNYLIGEQGKPYLIDPAISYGNREFDIAMTTLFGGFSPAFHGAYHESFPLAEGWQQRLDLWNLYPLLLHLNLFGTGYLPQVRSALKQYV